MILSSFKSVGCVSRYFSFAGLSNLTSVDEFGPCVHIIQSFEQDTNICLEKRQVFQGGSILLRDPPSKQPKRFSEWFKYKQKVRIASF